ncbi:MAG: S-layer homology domain-containing protein, partial [Selenomonadales bacterium]|nr:S-layer homology domain-containing protein [Selenomonadales bacterium]
MKKRLLKSAVLSALAVSFVVPALAPDSNELFAAVPTGHWAYDAVMSLADAGLIDGYEDGTFGGDRTMTRYEMAKIVDTLMEQTDTSDEQKALIDDLAVEFTNEIGSLRDEVNGIKDEQERIK